MSCERRRVTPHPRHAMKTLPASDDASRDPALRGNPLAVYRYLLDTLDPRDWHEVPQLALCAALGIKETAARRALELLVHRGYLELDLATRVGTGQARQYRLNFRRHEPLHSNDPAA
jgi:predicted ArsR family transcriptional regulator